jgi:S1-C subfamily serine protease
MENSSAQAADKLQRCTVKITIPGKIGWGTGFAVAPGIILTCKHVVKDAIDIGVEVYWPVPKYRTKIVEH